MVATAGLGAGWAWQALAAWLRIPAPAPRHAAARSTSVAAMATVIWMLPQSGRAIGVSSGVPVGSGLDVPDGLAAVGLDHGDREGIGPLAAPAGAGDDLADLHRDDHRAGGEVADLLAGHGPGRRQVAVVALGEDAGGPGGLGEGRVELGGGDGAQ